MARPGRSPAPGPNFNTCRCAFPILAIPSISDQESVTSPLHGRIVVRAGSRESIMRPFARTTVFAFATFGLVFGTATVFDQSAVSVVGCGPGQSCSVGGAAGGTGAVTSGGAAQ